MAQITKKQLESYDRKEARTAEETEYYASEMMRLYGIDVNAVPELTEYLLDFAESGASTATMRLINSLVVEP